MKNGLLSIAILSSGRFDLLEATIHSLLNTMTVPYFELIIFNHRDSIGKGWNYLTERINGEFVLMCQDDWYFMEKCNWAEICMQVLSKYKDVGMIRLRKNGDGQNEEKVVEEFRDHQIVECVGGGFTMNPGMFRKDTLDKLGNIGSIQIAKGVAELEVRNRWRSLELKTAKLQNPGHGVCIHIGRGRRVFGKET